MDWTKLGQDLRHSADAAHNGKTPNVLLAYQFLLENPECFSDSDEWPEFMPVDPNIEFIAAYYCAGTESDLDRTTRARKGGA
jgi:hypothetical protein